ncbi:MAG: choice-of-anchor V domain-containing protein, partial [Rhodothermales bacterium]|nr:choice-of-anchor V domain-containing protein [Rhodothermales bacterium]
MQKPLRSLGSLSVLSLAMVLAGSYVLFDGGAPPDYSGHGGSGNTCAVGFCHGGSELSNSAVFAIENVTPSEFTPGGTVSFDVVFKNPTGSSYGFEVSVGDPSNHVGTLVDTGTNVEFASGDTRFITQSNVNQTSWNVQWTAPASPPSAVTIWAAGLDTDNGEQTYVTSQVINQASLPVELAAFDVRLDGTTAVLDWKTVSEFDNVGFDVEHAEASGDFVSVGFVPGAGTTSEARDYSYTVAELVPGAHRFRLRQIDVDGTTSYSDQVEIAVAVPERFVLSEAYPNPFNPTTTFELAVKQEQDVRVRVYDEMGRHVTDL